MLDGGDAGGGEDLLREVVDELPVNKAVAACHVARDTRTHDTSPTTHWPFRKRIWQHCFFVISRQCLIMRYAQMPLRGIMYEALPGGLVYTAKCPYCVVRYMQKCLLV